MLCIASGRGARLTPGTDVHRARSLATNFFQLMNSYKRRAFGQARGVKGKRLLGEKFDASTRCYSLYDAGYLFSALRHRVPVRCNNKYNRCNKHKNHGLQQRAPNKGRPS